MTCDFPTKTNLLYLETQSTFFVLKNLQESVGNCLVSGLRSYKKYLRELRVFILEKRELRGNLIAFYSSLGAGCSQVEIGLFQETRFQETVSS